MTTGTNGQAVFDTPFSLSIKTRNETERLINAADEMGNATTDAAYITAKMKYFDAVCGVIKSVQHGLNRVEKDSYEKNSTVDDDVITCNACGGEGYIWTKHSVDGHFEGSETFKDECEACEGKGYIRA